MYELQRLCDKVPAFDNKMAMKTVEEELGASVRDVFSELSVDPVAAASLGQVRFISMSFCVNSRCDFLENDAKP